MSLLQKIKDKASAELGQKPLQNNAYASFENLGIPSRKHEEWKYLSFKNTFEQDFDWATEIAPNSDIPTHLHEIKANRLVFVNGVLSASHSQIEDAIEGLILCSLAEAQAKHANLFAKHFAQYASVEQEAFNALNTAFKPQGSFVYVPANAQCQFPFFIQHITTSTNAPSFVQLRNLWVVEAQAKAKFIEVYDSKGEHASMSNVVSEIAIAESASVENYKIQQQGIHAQLNHYTQIQQATYSNCKQITLSLSGAIIRNNLHFQLKGVQANCLLYGLYYTDAKRTVDNHTRVDHISPNCTSDEKYKGILKDESIAVFNGKIMVHLDAQKTAAYQRNQNILLSNNATIYTKPQLEIFADDVKCTHGATIGSLDEKSLFYLRSRGIPEALAKSMLLKAYAKDITDLIDEPILVQAIDAFIEKRI